jgi:hypothetical protein
LLEISELVELVVDSVELVDSVLDVWIVDVFDAPAGLSVMSIAPEQGLCRRRHR